jgi:uncharacterized membrane protein YdjX (TVP38/TMEM64 family)
VLYLDAATLAFATTALLLVYGRNYEAWQVAVFGGAASAAGSATQLLLLRWALASGQPWMRRFAPSRDRVQAALAKFPSASFLALTLARATPLPDAPLKIVAAVVGYPIYLYGLATFLGSIPYYWALALLGRAFKFPWWVLGAAAALFVVGIGVDALRRRRKAA